MARVKQHLASDDAGKFISLLALASKPSMGGELGLEVVEREYAPWSVTLNITRAKTSWHRDDVVIGTATVLKDSILRLAELIRNGETQARPK